MNPQLSIIIVSYNERDHLRRVLRALADEFSSVPYETIVVDNASADGSAELVRQEFPDVRLHAMADNLMFGRGMNVGMKAGRAEWLLLLNADIAWEPGQLRDFFSFAANRPDIALAGPQLHAADGRLQISAHRRFPNPWTVFVDYCLPLQGLLMRLGGHPYQYGRRAHRQVRPVAHLNGACLLVRRTAYEAIGGFDEQFTMYLEETEWQKRMADAGLGRWLIGTYAVTHYGSAQKSFAQASPHFLWGLNVYSRKYWRWPGRLLVLLKTLWSAALISDMVFCLGWLPSWLFGRRGSRLRHYGRQYLRLHRTLFTFTLHPSQRPS